MHFDTSPPQASAVQKSPRKPCCNHAALLACAGARFTPDIVSYGAAISACEAARRWYSALDLQSCMFLQRLETSTVAHGAVMSSINAVANWQLTLSTLAQLQQWKLTSIVAYNCVLVAYEISETARSWQQSLDLLMGVPRRRLKADLIGFNVLVSSCGKGRAWEMALQVLMSMPLNVLQPDLMTCDSILMSCLDSGETRTAFEVLSMSEHSRSPLSLLWSLSVLCVSNPETISMACMDAVDSDVDNWEAGDSALYLYSTALLGASTRRHEAVARHIHDRISSLSLDMLVMCCWGAIGLPGAASLMEAAVAHTQDVLRSVGRTLSLHNYDFPKSGLKLLGLVFSCRLSGCLQAHFCATVRRLLLDVGRDLDASPASPIASSGSTLQAIVKDPASIMELPRGLQKASVVVDMPDRAAVYKPRGWEVYGGHSQLQLVAFLLEQYGARRIFRDASHHHGFLHRLDVPSTGLILVSKTFEAFYDLQLQLHAGRVHRDYKALCHGWLPPRAEFKAQIYWHGDGPSVSGGRGKPSSTLLLLCCHCLHRLGTVSSLMLRLRTGRKHQIRSHLAHVGSPVIGDEVYQAVPTYRADSKYYTGNWLHRCRLSFQSIDGRRHAVECPLPPDLQAFLSQVRNIRIRTVAKDPFPE